jgi:hypothetical protein
VKSLVPVAILLEKVNLLAPSKYNSFPVDVTEVELVIVPDFPKFSVGLLPFI